MCFFADKMDQYEMEEYLNIRDDNLDDRELLLISREILLAQKENEVLNNYKRLLNRELECCQLEECLLRVFTVLFRILKQEKN